MINHINSIFINIKEMQKAEIFLREIIKIIVLVSILFVTNCNNKSEPIKILGNTMGTTYKIVIVPFNKKADKSKLKKDIDDLLKIVNLEMSTFIQNSEISKFNRSTSSDWFPVSAGFAKVVKSSLEISEKSNGAFDVSIGPLIELWGFGKKMEDRVPSTEEINSVEEIIGYRKLNVKKSPFALKKDVSGLQINLSAIAKGYGVDKIAEYLSSKGFSHYLVEIGGEVRVQGTKFKNKWRIGVVIPDTLNEYQKIVHLTDISLATSGDYFNYFEKDGIRYSHTIDPFTQKPITHKLASVTVAHETCMFADGYATAINVMGPEKGYNFALNEKLPVYMIIREDNGFIVKMTPAFRKYFLKK